MGLFYALAVVFMRVGTDNVRKKHSTVGWLPIQWVFWIRCSTGRFEENSSYLTVIIGCSMNRTDHHVPCDTPPGSRQTSVTSCPAEIQNEVLDCQLCHRYLDWNGLHWYDGFRPTCWLLSYPGNEGSDRHSDFKRIFQEYQAFKCWHELESEYKQ